MQRKIEFKVTVVIPERFKLPVVILRQKKMIGNAVCPPLTEALLKAVLAA